MPDLADRIREVLAAQLIEFTGECACDEAYTSRTLIDPHCAWHTAGGDEFAAEAASAVAASLTDGTTVEWGTRASEKHAVSPSANEYNARVMAEGGLRTAVSRTVIYGPWKES